MPHGGFYGGYGAYYRFDCIAFISKIPVESNGMVAMAYYRGKREAEAEGDAEPRREERSYGHGKGQPGPGKSKFLWQGSGRTRQV